MEHKNKLEELHKESLEKLEAYLQTKADTNSEHHEKAHEAKKEWQLAWNKVMEALMVLERLEI